MDETTYYGDWENSEDMLKDFEASADALKDMQVMFAEYWSEGYEGTAIVLLRRIVPNDGALFEVYASHCSCHGLEGQWVPEATTLDSLLFREGRGAWSIEAMPHRAEYVAILEALKAHPQIGS